MAPKVFLHRAGLLAFVVGRAAGTSVTPVQKVVGLLEGLRAKVEEEGKREAAEYDKYACFCKEQVDDKIYMIEKSDKTISSLEAVIGDLGADLSDLSSDISTLSGKIAGLEGKIVDAKKARDAEHKAYIGKEADVSGAIDAVERAIATLKQSKGQLMGKVDLEEALTQIQAAAHSVGLNVSDGNFSLLSTFRKGTQPGEAYQYEYHGNAIIATLEGLLATFKGNKQKLDLEEFQANSAFDKKHLDLDNEKTFAEKEKTEKEKLEAFKTEKQNEKIEAKNQEESDRKADKDFLKVLQSNCEEKAKAWDQRSQARTAELTALNDATESLKTGVVPNWSANRRLIGLQRGNQVASTVVSAPRRPASFIQLRGSGRRASQADAVRDKVYHLLSAAAASLGSPVLSVAALKVKTSKDVFVKVRSIINDIISKLKDQAKSEATTKSFCDTEMKAAITLRDQKKEELEGLEAKISSNKAETTQLKEEIAVLSAAIAANEKTLKEATELRLDEKKDNTQVAADATVGKDAVEYALKVLKKFYEPVAVLQYVPPDSDRSGKTVGDLAPKGFDTTTYKGQQEASKGIIGLLEVILADFDRTGTTVNSAEKLSADEFAAFEKATNDDTKTKKGDQALKEGDVTNLEDKLVKLEEDKDAAQKSLDGALSELEKLHSMCVAGEETFEERVAKREKEIEALKEAHAILEDWQG